ncbi:DUF4432 family protein [Acerihabitans sp. KWT182]|uniref:DUF4432 family protein n=1 Tax=Acerihabitans sp. KWT182 TaxID=3157919 RepID=A0AAU7Q4I6_9GAMM
MKHAALTLKKTFFSSSPMEIARSDGCSAELFTYETGIEAIRLKNRRGYLVVLPYYGQMIWQARFDDIDLAMSSGFNAPRPAMDIVGTYGCFIYHSGLLRNGNPGERDHHPLHGEMPLAPMDRAGIEIGEDENGKWMAVVGEREYIMGFGDHYMARPRVLIRPDQSTFEIRMEVENLGLDPMDLMYMCHANFAFVEGGRIVQPTGFGNKDTVIRTSVPAIVQANDDYLAHLARMKEDPSATEVIDTALGVDPELVFYLKNLKKAQDGLVHVMLRRPTGDAFVVAYDPDEFSHLVRWILANNKQKVCAFAMPATCGVEGHYAEKRLGNVRSLPGGKSAGFKIKLGYLNATEALIEESIIRASL